LTGWQRVLSHGARSCWIAPRSIEQRRGSQISAVHRPGRSSPRVRSLGTPPRADEDAPHVLRLRRTERGTTGARWLVGKPAWTCPGVAGCPVDRDAAACSRPQCRSRRDQCRHPGWLADETLVHSALEIAIKRQPEGLRAWVDLVDDRPRGGKDALIRWLYRQTQPRQHAWVGQRHLRQFGKAGRDPGG
jgi:hypothetical protein